jgi:hypothetical protein
LCILQVSRIVILLSVIIKAVIAHLSVLLLEPYRHALALYVLPRSLLLILILRLAELPQEEGEDDIRQKQRNPGGNTYCLRGLGGNRPAVNSQWN